ncbi:hypothetical protein C8R48DRAFT_216770 [Suillus tomentosus]|nr:hypothetical protein C8R48DRAFT_216770 [Suillus tomentosus]
MPTASFAFLIWCIVKAHGIGPIVHQPSILHGSKLGWAMVVTSQFHVMHRQLGDACHERTGLPLVRSHSIGRAIPTTIHISSRCIIYVRSESLPARHRR